MCSLAAGHAAATIETWLATIVTSLTIGPVLAVEPAVTDIAVAFGLVDAGTTRVGLTLAKAQVHIAASLLARVADFTMRSDEATGASEWGSKGSRLVWTLCLHHKLSS